jgi:pilus assembly protein Flp/PilA
MKTIFSFLREQSGVTSIEYAMIASCIAVVIVGSVSVLGSKVKNNYVAVQTALK